MALWRSMDDFRTWCFIKASGARGPDVLDALDVTRHISEAEHLRRFQNVALALYWQAERVRAQGRSWRNFHVGSGAWAYRSDASTVADRFQAFFGMNSKAQHDGRNICAEPIAIDGAATRGYTRIVGIVVVGEAQEDERGQTPRTLRPCAHCRRFMASHPLVRPDTLILCANPPKAGHAEPEEWFDIVHELFTFKELLALYGEEGLLIQKAAQVITT